MQQHSERNSNDNNKFEDATFLNFSQWLDSISSALENYEALTHIKSSNRKKVAHDIRNILNSRGDAEHQSRKNDMVVAVILNDYLTKTHIDDYGFFGEGISKKSVLSELIKTARNSYNFDQFHVNHIKFYKKQEDARKQSREEERLTDENEKLKLELAKEKEERNVQVQNLNMTLVHSQKKLLEFNLDQKLQTLTQEKSQLETQLSALQQEISKYVAQVSSLEKRITELKDQPEVLKALEDDNNSLIVQLSSVNTELQQKAQQLKDQNKKLEELKTLTDQQKVILDELADRIGKTVDVEKQNEQLQFDLSTVREEYKSLYQALENRNADIQRMSCEKSDLEAEVEQLQTEKKNSEVEIKEVKKQLEQERKDFEKEKKDFFTMVQRFQKAVYPLVDFLKRLFSVEKKGKDAISQGSYSMFNVELTDTDAKTIKQLLNNNFEIPQENTKPEDLGVKVETIKKKSFNTLKQIKHGFFKKSQEDITLAAVVSPNVHNSYKAPSNSNSPQNQ